MAITQEDIQKKNIQPRDPIEIVDLRIGGSIFGRFVSYKDGLLTYTQLIIGLGKQEFVGLVDKATEIYRMKREG